MREVLVLTKNLPLSLRLVPASADEVTGNVLFLSVYFVWNCQFLTALCAASRQHATSVSREHTLTETMLVVSFSVVRLKSSFHFLSYFYCLLVIIIPYSTHNFICEGYFRAAKLSIYFYSANLFLLIFTNIRSFSSRNIAKFWTPGAKALLKDSV